MTTLSPRMAGSAILSTARELYRRAYRTSRICLQPREGVFEKQLRIQTNLSRKEGSFRSEKGVFLLCQCHVGWCATCKCAVIHEVASMM